jgi:hypothetical protein
MSEVNEEMMRKPRITTCVCDKFPVLLYKNTPTP